jgi:hypothetical protein
VELQLPIDVNARERPTVGSSRGPHRQSSTRRSSLISVPNLIGRRRSSTASSTSSQIPSPVIGDESTFWQNSHVLCTEPFQVSGGSVRSRPESVSSGVSTSTHPSQRSEAQRSIHRQSAQYSISNTFNTGGPSSPLNVALTTRLSVWKGGGKPAVITKATLEGLIDYLLRNPAGERYISHFRIVA